MSLPDPYIVRDAATPGEAVRFAEPEWRGLIDERAEEARLRPLPQIEAQIDRLAAWITAGAGYGWLGPYAARRAGFDLQSIRAHLAYETAASAGRLGDQERRAVQSRLDRLQLCLEASRGAAARG